MELAGETFTAVVVTIDSGQLQPVRIIHLISAHAQHKYASAPNLKLLVGYNYPGYKNSVAFNSAGVQMSKLHSSR